MRAQAFCTAGALLLSALTLGCGSDRTVVRHETETIRSQPQVLVPAPTTERTTVIHKEHVEEDD